MINGCRARWHTVRERFGGVRQPVDFLKWISCFLVLVTSGFMMAGRIRSKGEAGRHDDANEFSYAQRQVGIERGICAQKPSKPPGQSAQLAVTELGNTGS